MSVHISGKPTQEEWVIFIECLDEYIEHLCSTESDNEEHRENATYAIKTLEAARDVIGYEVDEIWENGARKL